MGWGVGYTLRGETSVNYPILVLSVVAYWRHMATERRHALIAEVMSHGVKASEQAPAVRVLPRGAPRAVAIHMAAAGMIKPVAKSGRRDGEKRAMNERAAIKPP